MSFIIWQDYLEEEKKQDKVTAVNVSFESARILNWVCPSYYNIMMLCYVPIERSLWQWNASRMSGFVFNMPVDCFWKFGAITLSDPVVLGRDLHADCSGFNAAFKVHE